jgi:hypothetical protein
MTACTQPGCSSTIVDNYCEVCGSPAGAAPFVPAEVAASAASPAPGKPFHRESGFPAEPKTAGLMMACTQPGCSSTIVDNYCEVCGSPAGAVPFVPAAASAASPAPADEPGLTAASAPTPAPGLTALPAPTQVPAHTDEEIPTQRIPRVKMPRQHLSTHKRADPGAADPGAVDAQQVDREKVGPAVDDTGKVDGGMELAEGELDGAQDYRMRVEEAQLPDDVREAALGEVGKLEGTSDQSPESGDIRTWLDTILDLPWSTKTTDWIDIRGSREVEATLRRLIEPAVADLEEGDTGEGEPAATVEEGDTGEGEPAATDVEEADTAEVDPPAATDVEEADTAEVDPPAADVEEADTGEGEPAATDVEEADTAEVDPPAADVEEADIAEGEPAATDVERADTMPGGLEDDDTVRMPAVPAVLSGGRHQRPQLPEQQVLGPEPVQTPAKKRRFGYLALAAAALAALLIGASLFAASRDRGVTAQSVPTVTATATATVTKPTSEPSNGSTGSGRGERTIQLEDLADSARSFQTVRIEGMYRSGPDTFMQVQRWEGGQWLAFPLPTKTDQSGRFTAFVEFGQPGRYRLRVVDPDSGVTSKTFVLVITG